MEVLLYTILSVSFAAKIELVYGCNFRSHSIGFNVSLNVNPLDLQHSVSLVSCNDICSENLRCVSFNYGFDTRECEILDVDHCLAQDMLEFRENYGHFVLVSLPVDPTWTSTKTHKCIQHGLCDEDCNDLRVASNSRISAITCLGSCSGNNTFCDTNVCRCLPEFEMDITGTCVQDHSLIGTYFMLAFTRLYNKFEQERGVIVCSYSKNILIYNISSPAMSHTILGSLNASQCIQVSLPDIILDAVFTSNTFLITTTDRASVTQLNMQFWRTSAYSVPPISSLGTEYIVISPSQSTLNDVSIISTAMNNIVTLTMPDTADFALNRPEKTYGPRSSFSVTLQRQDAYYICEFVDLTGMTISSFYPVIVVTGAPLVELPNPTSKDPVRSVVPSIETLGKRHIIVSSPGVWAPKTYRILTVERDTTIQIYTTTTTMVISKSKAGSTYTFRLLEGPGSVISDKPVLVIGYLENSKQRIGDPDSIIIPPLDQLSRPSFHFKTTERYNRTNRFTVSYLVIALEKVNAYGLALNETPVNATWQEVPGLTQFVMSSLEISAASYILSHSASPPTLAIYYQFRKFEGQCYILGRHFRKLS